MPTILFIARSMPGMQKIYFWITASSKEALTINICTTNRNTR
jgi:hypothetical protein